MRARPVLLLAIAASLTGVAAHAQHPVQGQPAPFSPDSLTPQAEPGPFGDAPPPEGSAETDTPLDPAPPSGEAELKRLYAELAQAKTEQAAEPLSQAIEQVWLQSGSPTVDLLIERATQALGEDDIETSLSLLDAVVEIAPEYAEGWNQRAGLHFLKRDFGRSIEDLRRVLTIDPNHFKAIVSLGLAMQEIGDKKAALRAYRAALRVNPFLDQARQAADELAREVEGQGI